MGEGDEPAARCEYGGCWRPVVHGDHCFEHLDLSQMPALADRLRGGERLDASNTTIASARLAALLEALEGDDGLPKLREANFRGATFKGEANFRAATFGSVIFGDCTFEGRSNFSGAGFEGSVDFGSATFAAGAWFAGARFGGSTSFERASFGGDINFAHTDFAGDTYFHGAAFRRDAVFAEATFEGVAYFADAAFDRAADFREVRFEQDAVFRAAAFRLARKLGPLAVAGSFAIDDCLFAERVSIEVDATVVSAQTATFADGVHLRVCRAEIELDSADFARPSTLSGATTMPLRSRHDIGDDDTGPHELPRLLTLRGAHVAPLALSDLDLAACRFFGAHGLESLSIGANCRWRRSVSGVSREMLAEEHVWRDDDESSDLQPRQIAALYGALRKAREDGKDEAGASDLYFGEMEMRRHGAAKRSDRAVLWIYYLISGYGLRAGNAIATLLLTVVAASAGLWAFGFHGDGPSYTRALFVAIESTSSLLRTPDGHGLAPTYAGEVIQIVLRLLGPLLIGLALLAVRARVKR
jgi:uncharacterized protein YjbI with pentapeptide repeats